jgi:hypothetical protein
VAAIGMARGLAGEVPEPARSRGLPGRSCGAALGKTAADRVIFARGAAR